MSSPLLPDLDSPLSPPEILRFNLERNPTFPTYVYPEHGTGNLTEISMLEFVRSCYRVGNAVYGDSKPGDVVAIIANLDTIVYMALIAGLMNLGLVPFPISPRNSAPAITDLLRKSSAHRILTTRVTLGGVIDAIQSEIQSGEPYALSTEEAPTLQQVYPHLGKETVRNPFIVPPPLFFPKENDTAIYLHSSGSTGYPKAIRLSYLNFQRLY
ncbi:acetyl-CoA synthetase-like protein [Gymnopus androsaceus JB14]|uniref:Acetyl-CoA synthetase-like protein n=1 Tax=Gymnopus androsaceus JB14 TaxID=1447944 RepID=A0A6A4H3W9_9AGAR|nr:acetyl-CoA synthetase-like protein [Gymnopus androsaceus JB14]